MGKAPFSIFINFFVLWYQLHRHLFLSILRSSTAVQVGKKIDKDIIGRNYCRSRMFYPFKGKLVMYSKIFVKLYIIGRMLGKSKRLIELSKVEKWRVSTTFKVQFLI